MKNVKPVSGKTKPLNNEYLTSRQAATLLRVSLRTVQLWVEKGVLDAWKTPGGHRRIPLQSVEELIEQKERELSGVAEKRILVVEDLPSQRLLYRKLLEKMALPLELHMAEDGFRGLLKIGELTPDIIITDLEMPGMDGFRMLEAIRRTPGLNGMSLIVATALERSVVAEKGLMSEEITVLHKPISYAALKKAVEEKLPEAECDPVVGTSALN